MKNPYQSYASKAIMLAAASFFAGLVNGIFGTGGGIIIVFVLSGLYAESQLYHAKDVYAMTVGAVLIMSIASLCTYMAKDAVSSNDIFPYLLPAAFGGPIGAVLLNRFDAAVTKKIFAVLVIYAGITLIFR